MAGRTGELTVKGGSLSYLIKNDEARVERCRVLSSVVEIPDEIEGFPVTVIGKKALLGEKLLEELFLPVKVREVEDWAFARCDRLRRVSMPRRQILFGKGVFKDCRKLSRIDLNGTENKKIAGLLAMTPVMLDAEYLLSPMDAGERIWLEKLDARLLTLLEKPDEEGYLKQVLCGEEDLMASLPYYLAGRRREKAQLCFLRLLNDFGLKEELRNDLREYLRENTKGCEYEAAWEIVIEEHGQDREYYRIFAEAGCIREENFDGLLLDMGENTPEMKAWLLRYREEEMRGEDFFAGFSLD